MVTVMSHSPTWRVNLSRKLKISTMSANECERLESLGGTSSMFAFLWRGLDDGVVVLFVSTLRIAVDLAGC